jgi:CBS-domain-containing membrane protein
MSPERILTKLGVTSVVTVSCEDTVEKALKLLQEKGLRAAPVINDKGEFQGMFSSHDIIKALVPSYMTQGIATLDFATGASSVLSSRLKKMFPSRVGDHVSCDDCVKITDKTQTWETLRMLTKYGSPLPIVNVANNHFLGLISEQSAIDSLMKMEAEDGDNDN